MLVLSIPAQLMQVRLDKNAKDPNTIRTFFHYKMNDKMNEEFILPSWHQEISLSGIREKERRYQLETVLPR